MAGNKMLTRWLEEVMKVMAMAVQGERVTGQVVAAVVP